MWKEDVNDNGAAGDKSGSFLKNAMEENALRLQQLGHHQLQKIAELSKVQEELKELNMLYPGNKLQE